RGGGGRARAGGAQGAARAVARSSARDECGVLGSRRARLRADPARPDARDVRLRACGGLVGAHPRAEAPRPPRSSLGALHRPAASHARRSLTTLADAASEADALAEEGKEREL